MSALTSPNIQLEKRLNLVAYIVSAAVFFLVLLMRRVKIDLGVDFSFLPSVIASLNALTAVMLLFSLYFIKNKQIENHRRANYAALSFSVLFLLCYVLYHFTTPEIRYGDFDHNGIVSAEELARVGSSRVIYLVVLLTHIFLAAVILPFILLTFIRAYTGQYERHRRMARWVYPFWLYVAISGPICYLMLRPFYP